MIVREILPEERVRYNDIVNHPLQSYEWGEFRKKMGVPVVRLGLFEQGRLINGFQFTLHKVPFFGFKIGYLPKGPKPDRALLQAIKEVASKNNCSFVKIEPNIEQTQLTEEETRRLKEDPFLIKARKPLFTKYTFYLDLTQTEEEFLAQMKEKTRYNVRLAQKKGVVVAEENSQEAFEIYLSLLKETTRRDRFFAHNESYHRAMWDILSPSGMARLLVAYYNQKPLVAWILFIFKDFLYYAYGASSSQYREVMASNLMYFEAFRLGRKLGLKTFDLWGSLGPNPNPQDPFYGFHRFKEGYAGKLVEFMGSYDLVLNQFPYQVFHFLDEWRFKILNLRNKLPF